MGVGRTLIAAAFAGGALAASLAVAPAAGASPYVQAHRGGPLARAGGHEVPAYPENTLPAFRSAARRGFVLELDVKLTADRVPVVIHDATLDRTTNCHGLVASKTAAFLARHCRVDVLGTEGNSVPLPAGDPRRARIPRLRRVLELAKSRGTTVSLEIKNIPTDPDFDPTNAFARTVVRAIARDRFPPSLLIVQSFWPPNLDVVKRLLPGAQTSLLTLAAMNAAGPAFARSRGYDWISPAWPVSAAYVSQAHALGLQVVPYTFTEPAEVERAARRGVDAVIANDPGAARRAVAAVDPPAPKPPPPPTPAQCERVRASRSVAPVLALDPRPGALRVFAMQFKQDLANVRTYAAFRTKVECMLRDYVVPYLARHRPNVVAFNEDVGLMTLGTGTRGAAARALFADPRLAPSCESQGVPCGTLAALAAVTAGYSQQVAAYHSRFGPSLAPVASAFVAGTDTFARGWMQTFSDLAKRYGVYMVGSSDQPPFRESVDPAEIAAFRDPDLPRPASVYVATSPRAYNTVFMWGPHDVRREGPPMLRNVVAENEKVPLTPIEQEIQLTPGPARGPDAILNLRPYALPGTKARIGFATSLPAFVFNGEPDTGFGRPLPPGTRPCSDVSRYYMRCLDALGANLVIQDEANPGRWATPGSFWQPLEWMGSTWRTVGDPTVGFDYNVTPMMVGNLADLAFDGQTAITQRGLATGPGCNYVGDSRFQPADPPEYRVYAGPKTEFLGIAPWVRGDGPRDQLAATGAALAPGSGSPLENDYVETAVIADLPFPPDPGRPSCAEARP